MYHPIITNRTNTWRDEMQPPNSQGQEASLQIRNNSPFVNPCEIVYDLGNIKLHQLKHGHVCLPNSVSDMSSFSLDEIGAEPFFLYDFSSPLYFAIRLLWALSLVCHCSYSFVHLCLDLPLFAAPFTSILSTHVSLTVEIYLRSALRAWI